MKHNVALVGFVILFLTLCLVSMMAPAAVTVTEVTSAKDDGSYKAGVTIDITVTFSESVTYTVGTGGLGIELETGTPDTTVVYTSGSPGAVLTFTYTVEAGNTSADLDYKATDSLALTGNATLKDTSTGLVDVTLTLAEPGASGSLGNAKALVIDTTAPTVTIDNKDDQAAYTAESTINFTIVSSESTANLATGDVTITGTAGGTLVDTITGSTTTYNAAIEGMTTAGTVIVSMAAGKFTDAAGNENAASTSTLSLVYFGIAPVITVDPVSQTVNIGDSVTFGVVVTGTEPISYQWSFLNAGTGEGEGEGEAIEGATAASYTIEGSYLLPTPHNGAASTDQGQYYCAVTSPYGEDSANTATLSVFNPSRSWCKVTYESTFQYTIVEVQWETDLEGNVTIRSPKPIYGTLWTYGIYVENSELDTGSVSLLPFLYLGAARTYLPIPCDDAPIINMVTWQGKLWVDNIYDDIEAMNTYIAFTITDALDGGVATVGHIYLVFKG